MKRIILFSLLICAACPTFAQEQIQYDLCDQDFGPLYLRSNLPTNAIYIDSSQTPEARAKDVIRRLSFDEKLMLTGGWNQMHFPGVPRLGLRPIYFSDASQGIHVKHLCVVVDSSTAFPCELALAATWNPELAYNYAKSIGEECRFWGVSVLLGPGLNMYRNAEGGRNFEYMGEDPFLTSAMGVQYVRGLQSTGTLATIKHFIGNEQEFARHIINVKIGARALREIYLPPFLSAINQGGAMAVMTGNNFVNGYPGAADKPISEDILRKEYHYQGIIMSDWANGMFWRDRQDLVLGSGQSLLMADNRIFSNYIEKEIQQHPEKRSTIEQGLDSMVFYNLYTFFKQGFYDVPYRDPGLSNKMSLHKQIALKTAQEAITLLKNEDQILPLDPRKTHKIVVAGDEKALTAFAGNGSGKVEGYDRVDYLSGLKNVYGDQIAYGDSLDNAEIKSADAVLYFITKKSSEGADVPFDIPGIQETIDRYQKLNKNIVVIFSGGNGFGMPWLHKVKGLIFAYLLGQESGVALADVVSGRTNPSGKLPFTIEKDFNQSPAYDYNKMSDGKYYWGGGKGVENKYAEMFGKIELPYKEGVYIGYRWFDKNKLTPQFPFGFGLSYTSFKISGIKVSSTQFRQDKPVQVIVTVTNTGRRAGAQTLQLYIHPENKTSDRPVKELKGFQKVFLSPGESREISIPIGLKDIRFWDDDKQQWRVLPGDYTVEIGTSSKDIFQKISIKNTF